MSTAIILGGSGFIGSHLTRHLTQDLGYEVVVVDLVPPASPSDSVRFVRADVRDPLKELGLPPSPDLVVNLAALHREPGHEEHEYFATNVGGADNVTEMCTELDARSVIFCSSISVYGTTELAIDESAPLRPETAYGQSKLQAEQIHREWAAEDSSRALSVVRPAAIFGAGEGGNFTRLASALERGRFVFPGRRDTIKGCGYVVDLVRSLLFMHGRPEGHTFNFALPREHTIEEICETLCSVGGLRRPRGIVPLSIMRTVGTVADTLPSLGASGLSKRRIEKLVTSTNIHPTALIEAGFQYEFDLRGAFSHWFQSPPAPRFV